MKVTFSRFKWHPRKELNLRLILRRDPCCPLHHGGVTEVLDQDF